MSRFIYITNKSIMYKLISVIILLASFTTLSGQNNKETYRNPVIRGDFPDPTIIRVGEDYYASGTSSDFVPCYPLYHSRDLINWKQIGSIFNQPPKWAKGDFWAPELFYRKGVFYVYYTARRACDNVSCIGVATTSDLTKGFEDHGIIIEWGKEAIDAYVFEDEDGSLYISWKAYGLEDHPIEILACQLSKDGLSTVGKPFSLTNNKFEVNAGIEGQCMVKHGKYYYLFYSVGGCCDNKCDYRVGVARSLSLQGSWEPFSGNPILQGGGLWRCPGHGTIVRTREQRYFYLYHAYHFYDFEFVGRQALLDEVLWDKKSEWPYFKYGRMPSVQAEVPLENTFQVVETEFYDNFNLAEKKHCWQWDINLSDPPMVYKDGFMVMAALSAKFNFTGIPLKTGNYTLETAVMNNDNKTNFKGVSVYGDRNNLICWGIEGPQVKLYQYQDGIRKELYGKACPASRIYLRIASSCAKLLSFYWSVNQRDWNQVLPNDALTEINIDSLPRWGRGLRAGILVENKKENGNSGSFLYFDIVFH